MSTVTITEPSIETSTASDQLTEALEEKLSHPATSPDFDLHAATSWGEGNQRSVVRGQNVKGFAHVPGRTEESAFALVIG